MDWKHVLIFAVALAGLAVALTIGTRCDGAPPGPTIGGVIKIYGC